MWRERQMKSVSSEVPWFRPTTWSIRRFESDHPGFAQSMLFSGIVMLYKESQELMPLSSKQGFECAFQRRNDLATLDVNGHEPAGRVAIYGSISYLSTLHSALESPTGRQSFTSKNPLFKYLAFLLLNCTCKGCAAIILTPALIHVRSLIMAVSSR